MIPTAYDIEQVRGHMELQAMAACWADAPPHVWQEAAVDYFRLARSLDLQPQFSRPIPTMPFGPHKDEALLDIAKKHPNYLNNLLAKSKSLGEPFRADIRRALAEAKSSPPDQSSTFSTTFPGGAKVTLRIHPEGYSIAWTNPPKTPSQAKAVHPLVVKWLKDCAVDFGFEANLFLHSFWLTAPTVTAPSSTSTTANT